jgi:hypothetical protein
MGFSLLLGIGRGGEGRASFGGWPAAVNTALQRCVAAQFGPLQSGQTDAPDISREQLDEQ